ncbi:MAG: DNA topoisomerase III [Oscillospiraceae bacterium]|nr:DNA topoisomerase III [Oscillospiraceae bacterium]
MNLIIAEKKTAAQAFSAALGVTGKKSGYFENDDCVITWCSGHLVKLAEPESYDPRYKSWNVADLPIVPAKWKHEVADDEHRSSQYAVIESLMRRDDITQITNACDAGREGELIFRLVYNQAQCNKTIKRLWISSMEEAAIRDGFANLKDGADYDNLCHAAQSRQRADWVVGYNGTRLLTTLYNKTLKVGRVQTPTLAMLCERLAEIANFVKQKHYNANLTFNNGEGSKAVIDKIEDFAQADKIVADCDGKSATVSSVVKEKHSEKPPKLYDLTSLQREANRLFGYTAQQSLDCVQALYEKGLCSYPRTDSRYITDDMAETVGELIGVVAAKMPFDCDSNTANIAVLVNNDKVSDHYAILPTTQVGDYDLETLPETERKILLLIAHKLLCAVGEKHVYESIKAELTCENHIFTAKGRNVLEAGWTAIEKSFKEFVKADTDDENAEAKADKSPLALTEGQKFENCACKLSEHWSKPKLHYTEDTLLAAMERAGAKDVTEDVERSGLGTPATRAGIIEKLITDGYASREKKNIVATDAGVELIGLAPEILKSPKFTAEWEDGLARISQGNARPDTFMEEVGGLIREIVDFAKANIDTSKVAARVRGEVIGRCPRCGGDVCVTPKAYNCSGEDCKFGLWIENPFFVKAKKAFSKEIAAALLKDGRVKADGFMSAKNTPYSAIVVLDDTGTYVNLKFEFEAAQKEIVAKCPRCGGDVAEMPKSYACLKDGCKFVLWKSNKLLDSMKKPLTKPMAVALLKNGKVWVEGLFSTKSGKAFAAMVVLDDTGSYVNLNLDFEQKKVNFC